MTFPVARSTEGPLRPGRCACGHLPGDHMRVVALDGGQGGGFRLEASGPCARCGSAACPHYRPGAAPAGAP